MSVSPRRSIRALAIVLVALLPLGACSHNDDAPGAAPSDIRSNLKSTSVPSGNVSGASMTSTSLQEPSDISVTVPTITSERNLTQAIEVVRERTLRGAAWESATKVAMTGHFTSSTTDLLGVELQAEVTKDKKSSKATTTLWYDATMKQTLSASALISWPGWPRFSQQVVKTAKADGLDAKKAEAALQQPQTPYGTGPALSFDSKGDMLVRFPAGAIDTVQRTVMIDSTTISPMLSGLGQKALGASLHPTSFTGTPSTDVTWFAKLKTSPKASDSPNTKPLPGDPATTSHGKPAHPSTAVGVDCIVNKCVALTYDDGPADTTTKIIEGFSKTRAAATFFQLGTSVDTHPETTKLLAGSGFEVGSHSATNQTLTKLGPKGRAAEITEAAASLAKLTGRPPMLFRPPYGAHNENVDATMAKHNLAMINWTADSNDWKDRNAAKIIDTVTDFATTYTQPIIVLHDTYPSTADATTNLIEGLHEQGMVLVTVSELTLNTGGMEAGKTYCRGTAVNQSGIGCEAS
ncbi:polysaccharide deacetylase family protein [Cutibacterium sp. V947]|uniref:polysaccharide deacetylase family protein n=1 Tax=Cutibacterium sp. V947 TaxID=3446480 RepID=UPI003EE2D65B